MVSHPSLSTRDHPNQYIPSYTETLENTACAGRRSVAGSHCQTYIVFCPSHNDNSRVFVVYIVN